MRKNYAFINTLLSTYRASPVTIVAITQVNNLPKDHPLKGKLYKYVVTNGFVRINYEKHVRKVTGDPNFVAGGRKWGHHVWSDVVATVQGEKRRVSALIEHQGQDGSIRHYIDFIERKKIHIEYVDVNGKHVDFDSSILVTRNEPVKVRNYELNNVLEIRVGGRIIRPN